MFVFSGKLITFLVNKFLVSPHLSLAQAAHSMACGRMEYLLSVHKEEAAMQMSQEELVSGCILWASCFLEALLCYINILIV